MLLQGVSVCNTFKHVQASVINSLLISIRRYLCLQESMIWVDWQVFQPISNLYFTYKMTLTTPLQSNKTFPPLTHWRHINNLKTPPTLSDGEVKTKRSWRLLKHPCCLQGGGVKYNSEGRIIIGSSWWRVFRRRGVPSSLHLIPSLLSHLGSFPTLFFISWQTSRGLEVFWIFKDTLATTLEKSNYDIAKTKLARRFHVFTCSHQRWSVRANHSCTKA